MPEFTPIARSPIATQSVQSGSSSSATIRIADGTLLAKLIVRAAPDGAAASALGVAHGEVRRNEDDVLVVGSSPGEWTLIGGECARLAQRAREADSDAFTAVIDQTHGRALIRLTGTQAKDLLAKVCGIDLHDRITPNGTAFRSSVAKVVTDVARDDQAGTPCYWLHCERSSGQYLFDALVDAGREFGIERDALD